MKLAGHYRVRGFPMILLFEDGEERGRFHGAHPAPFVRAHLLNHSRRLPQEMRTVPHIASTETLKDLAIGIGITSILFAITLQSPIFIG